MSRFDRDDTLTSLERMELAHEEQISYEKAGPSPSPNHRWCPSHGWTVNWRRMQIDDDPFDPEYIEVCVNSSSDHFQWIYCYIEVRS